MDGWQLGDNEDQSTGSVRIPGKGIFLWFSFKMRSSNPFIVPGTESVPRGVS